MGCCFWDPSQYEPLQVKGYIACRFWAERHVVKAIQGLGVQYGFEGLRLEENGCVASRCSLERPHTH